MRKVILALFLFGSYSLFLKGQTVLLREGVVITSTETGTWLGDKIPHLVQTQLTYRNNCITSVNTVGYLLCAGDETPSATNNNLDGAVITGNKFEWLGANSPQVITHGLFTGYNVNTVVKYNFLSGVPYGIIFKSGTDEGENMTFTSGGCAYNICRNGKFGARMKGISGVKIYNNTFYNDDNSGWYLLYISANEDRLMKSLSTGSKVFNNIFYSTTQIPMIKVDPGCDSGFECDYNLYWCKSGQPVFMFGGVVKTWDEWRSLGYDTHSVIADPNFLDTLDLVPAARLDFGINLGDEWQEGLSVHAGWIPGISPETTIQNGSWQVGARIYADIKVSEINISGETNTISTDKGTLQLTATVLPETATNKAVTWSVTNGSGEATISPDGLLTAINNGTVTATATATDGSGVSGNLEIVITNQVTAVNAITISSASGSNIISTDKGTLQLTATVLPETATNKVVTWSVTNGSGEATISPDGLLTAINNGTVTATATATDGSGVAGNLEIVITNQFTAVSAITIISAGGSNIISTDKGTLQLTATVLPETATNKAVTWSVTNGSGEATISPDGLLTAINNGTVTATATATDGSGVAGNLEIVITNQVTRVSSITISGSGGSSTISTDKGTLQLTATVLPETATNKVVTWSVTNGSGEATISPDGLLTAINNGTVTATATATDGSGVAGNLEIVITNQVTRVSSITISGSGGSSTISTDKGTLQLTATVLPETATNKAVTWSIKDDTGLATVSESGLVTAVKNGSVTVQATASDGSGVTGLFQISITNQWVFVNSIIVTGENGSDSIFTHNGTLQLNAAILPVDATDMSVSWSITNGANLATINNEGLVSAKNNGIVEATAYAKDGSGVSGSINITITNQEMLSDEIGETEKVKNIAEIRSFGDHWEVKMNADHHSYKIYVYSLTGVLMQVLDVESKVTVIDSSRFAPGMYMVVITNNKTLKGYKIVKL